MPNRITPEQLESLHKRFSGELTREAALETLREAGRDNGLQPFVRSQAAFGIIDLHAGRSVKRTMARFRRAVGLDAPKAAESPDDFSY